ncbi:hypothetical protein CMV_019037 [Castanea mollissima]|uniref:Rab3GAP catalytic subunit conserved domain-containing protein n=1 Tax=Castanea mollissima TaxID=60419 RepID=A0A8J4VP27_9ROSI|nr:hypothetical protein CMV_019037 [Castanea mollissima]
MPRRWMNRNCNAEVFHLPQNVNLIYLLHLACGWSALSRWVHCSKYEVSNESKNLRWRPAPIGTKQDWQDRLRSIKFGSKVFEDSEKVENSAMSVPFYDENLYLLNMKNDLEAKSAEVIPTVEGFVAVGTESIPPSSVIKQLAVAVEAGKKLKSLKDCLASSASSSPVRERAGLCLSAVKSLVLREKEEKLTFDYGDNEKVLSLINSLFDAEGNFLRRKISYDSEATTVTSLPRYIHGAPAESLVVKLAEVIGSFKTLQKMVLFWSRVVVELRRVWSKGQYVAGIPMDEIPDLNSCLLYQQLQVINCCVSRKRRQAIATESLDSVMREVTTDVAESASSQDMLPSSPILYARISTGELVLRLGADCPCSNLTMLETGEPVYSLVTQEAPLLTEDLIKETEEFVLRTGKLVIYGHFVLVMSSSLKDISKLVAWFATLQQKQVKVLLQAGAGKLILVWLRFMRHSQVLLSKENFLFLRTKLS